MSHKFKRKAFNCQLANQQLIGVFFFALGFLIFLLKVKFFRGGFLRVMIFGNFDFEGSFGFSLYGKVHLGSIPGGNTFF